MDPIRDKYIFDVDIPRSHELKSTTVHDLIKQETATIVFKSISGLAPTYLLYYISYFIFDLFREGSPSTKVVFQGALQ